MQKNSAKNVSQVNTMVSSQYEVFHVRDVVDQQKTLYHYHDFYEIHATLEGVGTFYLDGKEFDIGPGTVSLICYNDLHRIIKQNTNYFERVYIFLTPDFLRNSSTKWTNLEACFESPGGKRSRMLKTDPVQLKEQLAFIDEQPDPEKFGSDIDYQQQIIKYMMFLNQLAQSEENESTPKLVIENERVERMIQYITEHISNPLTLDEMEQHFFVSKYYITREFKKYTGLTFHQYVMKKKLLYAKQLLREYENSSEIYGRCGFTSYSHFLKAFKKEFQMTPKEFVQKNKENQKIHFQHYED